jgi:hypothetical protein
MDGGVIAQDVSGWDQRFCSWFSYWFWKAYVNYYEIKDPRLIKIYRVLIWNLTHVTIAIQRRVPVETNKGIVEKNLTYLFEGVLMPSGGPVTAPFNSAVNSVKFRVIMSEIVKTTLHTSLRFREYCYYLVFGDDLFARLKKVISYGKFNLDNDKISQLVSHYAKLMFDHEHTSAAKQQINGNETLETGDFLKRRFMKIDERIVCPLEREEIQQSLMWVRKGENSETKQFVINSHNALHEFSWHGKEVFEEEKERLNKVLKELGAEFTLTYEELRARFTTANYILD